MGQSRELDHIFFNDNSDEPVSIFNNTIIIVFSRSGDTSGSVSVVCFTVSGTARGSTLTGLESGSDFKSRGMTMQNTVVFPPGVLKASCDVKVRLKML